MFTRQMHTPAWFAPIRPYVEIARIDHWFKNVFMLPGVVFAVYDVPSLLSWGIVPPLILGFLSAGLVASSNYTLNEVLDAPRDALHPVKRLRAVPSGRVNIAIAYVQWGLLAALGLAIGTQINAYFAVSLLALFVMGILYNVPPVRLKDKPYLDVLSESVNNPLRLMLGWFCIDILYPPTLSLIMAYWMIGAFFMTVKRYAEYKHLDDPDTASRYRDAFRHYNEYRLLLSSIYYASAFSLFFGIFIVRYRMELILAVPLIAGFIAMYMRIGFLENSPAQNPERLYKQTGFMLYTALCVVVTLGLLFWDVPAIYDIFAPVHLPGR
jgi:4-hydroxybenzoate polyprenyltransferase